MSDLNKLLRDEPALYENQFNQEGFEWVDLNHRAESVVVYKRKGKKKTDDLLIILNMTPVVRMDWDIYLHDNTYTREIFNSDSKMYWGTGDVYNPDIRLDLVDKDQKRWKLRLNLPPLGAVILK